MTSAPRLFATSEVLSVDPLSTTITWSTNLGIRLRTCSIPCSSFRHGMTTVMDWSLYTKLNCNAGAPRYDEIVMKYPLFLLSLLVGSAVCPSFPDLANVHNVYILPMNGGLDQYLAKSLI